ncbi:MAG: hypothetical protein HQ483_06210 [Rhodospirillales bacterium]|nr:hypothetical protein [Rhodospirillales bacterium]
MKFISIFSVCLLASLSTVSGAIAEEGVLNALSIREMPQTKLIHVQTLDDSDENILLVAEFVKQLEENGFTISKTAEMILNFESRDQIGDWDSGSSRHLLELEAKGGIGDADNRKARVNVFDSNRGGLLNKGSSGTGTSSTASKYRLEVTVEGRSDGKTYWRGWSVADLTSGEGLTLTKKMILPLVQSIGQTVRSQPFPTD